MFAGQLGQGQRDVHMMRMLKPQCDNLRRIFSLAELEAEVIGRFEPQQLVEDCESLCLH